MLFPALTFRTIGIRTKKNTVGKSHNTANNRKIPGASSLGMVLFRTSRIAKGSTRTKLMMAANPRAAAVLLIVFLLVISSTLSFMIPNAVSTNIQRT